MKSLGDVKIGTAARAAGITVRMARHYEAAGLLPPAIRDDAGSRLFSTADVHTLRFIGRARSLGFSLKAIRKLLSLWQDAHRSNAETLHLAEKHMTDLLQKQSELTAMISTLQQLIDARAGDGRPECPILDDLAIGSRVNGSTRYRTMQRARGRAAAIER
ncbi:MAG: MerR family DNA-binding protein [Rhodobiaceae bacterium]|jgi:Cu(I)-responsive transcriptional regulator|nr:MerR family DNA-binding protein [Rhodobiaceae bacterium]